MKFKPDGWVHKDWKTFMPNCDVLVCRAPWGFNVESHPVCLVPPALLDWVDEVERAVRLYVECVERDDTREEETIIKLLDKLKEVRG